MKARIVKATVNNQTVWRVYYEQELLCGFEKELWARRFADYLNDNF
jgi:hypothetical protein